MILADSSVWIKHLRSGDEELTRLLNLGRVILHPFIVGELACGSLRNREEILRYLTALPEATVASHDEVMTFIENRKLVSRGLGYVDVHLLASAAMSRVKIWTLDKRLQEAAKDLDLA